MLNEEKDAFEPKGDEMKEMAKMLKQLKILKRRKVYEITYSRLHTR